MGKLIFGGAGSWGKGAERLGNREGLCRPAAPHNHRGVQASPSAGDTKPGWRAEGHPRAKRTPSPGYLWYLQARLLGHVLAEVVEGGGHHLLSLPQGRLTLVAGPQQLLVVHQVDGAASHAAFEEEPAAGKGLSVHCWPPTRNVTLLGIRGPDRTHVA